MIFKSKKHTGRHTVLGIDFGASELKAVVLAQTGADIELQEFVVAPLPGSFGQAGAEQQAGAQLQQVLGKLRLTERRPFVSLSCPSATIAEAELPRMPLEEARSVLRLNSQRYLRRDLANCCLDLCEFEPTDPKARKANQMRAWVATAAREEVHWCRNVLVAAKARPQSIELSALTVVNALQCSHPELCEKEVVLLLDIGARVTSINILRQGELVISRLMNFGGAQLTDYISQVLALPTAEAEQQKRLMSETVAPLVQAQLFSLVREVRASMDFIERQQECSVSHAFICGGTAASAPIVQFLSENTDIAMEQFNPFARIKLDACKDQAPELLAMASGLVSAVGVAVAHLGED